MTRTEPEEGSPGPAGRREGWAGAAAKAAAVLVCCYALLLYVPNRLLAYLTTRVTPNARDSIALAWEIAFFVLLAWAFAALQRGRRP